MHKKPYIIASVALVFGLLTACSVPQSTKTCQGHFLKTCNPNLYFDFNSTKLNDQAVENLDWVVNKMEKRPEKRVVVSGFADMVGDDASNLKVSKMRADTVKDYIISKGISGDRIDVRYVGKTQLASHEADKQDAERRVEVKFENDKEWGLFYQISSLFNN